MSDRFRLALPLLLLLLITALATGVRLAYIDLRYTADLRAFQNGDYVLYWHGGEHIRAEGNFNNSLFLFRPPAFPLLIAALDGESRAVLIANVLIGALLAPLSVVLARQLGLGRRLALAVGVVVALDPASVVYSAWLGSEPLANVFLLVMLIALLHAVFGTTSRAAALAWGAGAGLALVISVLARPAAYLIWIGLATWLLIARRSAWPAVAAYVLVGVVGIGAWVVHNGGVLGNYTVSNVGAYNLLYYRAASVEYWGTGHDMSTVYADLSRRVEARLGHDTSLVDANTRHTHYAGPGALTAAMTATALDTFRRYPLAYVLTIPIGLARLYGYTNLLPAWTRAPEIVWNVIFVAGAGAGLWLAYRRRAWRLTICTGLVIAYFTVGTLVAQTSGMDTRMRTMLAPLLAALLVYALDAWLVRYRAPHQG